MRFPDLLSKVLELESRLTTYERDINYLLNEVRKIKEDLDQVRTRDPKTGKIR